MKTKEIIKRAREFAEPFRISKGRDFRLKDVDPDDTLEFTKEADKPRAKEALSMGVAALEGSDHNNTFAFAMKGSSIRLEFHPCLERVISTEP